MFDKIGYCPVYGYFCYDKNGNKYWLCPFAYMQYMEEVPVPAPACPIHVKWDEHIRRFSWDTNNGDKRYRSHRFCHFTSKCKVTVKDGRILERNHYNLIMGKREDYDEHDMYKKDSVLFKC